MKYQNNCESSNDQQKIRTVDKVTLISRGSVCLCTVYTASPIAEK